MEIAVEASKDDSGTLRKAPPTDNTVKAVVTRLNAGRLISVCTTGNHLTVNRPAMSKIAEVDSGMIDMFKRGKVRILTLYHAFL